MKPDVFCFDYGENRWCDIFQHLYFELFLGLTRHSASLLVNFRGFAYLSMPSVALVLIKYGYPDFAGAVIVGSLIPLGIDMFITRGSWFLSKKFYAFLNRYPQMLCTP